MRKYVAALVAGAAFAFPSPASAPAATTSTTTTVALVPSAVMGEWAKVAWCETHGDWHHAGPRYDGGLGIMPANWVAYGGLKYAPQAHLATPEEQVRVAININGTYVPDQDGECHAW